MLLPLDLLFEYWIEHATFGLHDAMFWFSTKVFHREFQTLQLIAIAVFGAVD